MSKNPGLFGKTLVIGIIILLIGTVFLPVSGTANIIKTFEVAKIGSGADLECEGEIVIKRIRTTKGVMDTKTLIGTKSLSGA